MSSFEDAMLAAGLRPREIVADGKWRRCSTDAKPKKRNGAYILYADGRGYYRDHAQHAELIPWRDGAPVSTAQLKRNEQFAAEQRARDRAARIEGMQQARGLWARCARYSPHTYLTDKGLTAEGCAQLRTWFGRVWIDKGEFIQDTWLVVPLYWRDRLVNVQRISSTGVKRQMKGAPQKGCYLILDRPGAALTVIVEGLATGLAVFQSIRTARVVVAFFADNLVPVVDALRPTGNTVVVADNDHQTAKRLGTNPGIEKATSAAELIGAGVWWPTGIDGTDAADALKEWGERAAKRLEREILAKARYIVGAIA